MGRDPKNPDLPFNRGLIGMKLRAYNGAKLDFEKSYELGSRKKSLIMSLGEVNYTLGNKTNSIIYFNRIIKKDSTNAEAYLNSGIAKLYISSTRFQSLKDRCEESVTDFDKAIKFNEQYKEALILRGFSNFYLGKNKEAAVDLLKAIEIAPQNQVSYVLLGRVYLDMKLNKDACLVFEKAKLNNIEIPDKFIRKACGH